MTGNPVYPQGELRPVLEQRFRERAARHHDRHERARAQTLADAIAAGQVVTVTFEELRTARWHAGLVTAWELHDFHNAAAAAGTTHYTVEADGGFVPA
jgi:hypothetical protein